MSDYQFQASGDACGVCQSLDGSACFSQPHDSCKCEIVEAYHCETNVQFTPVVHTGPGEYDYAFGAEVSVTCPDGSTLGMSVAVILNENNIYDSGDTEVDAAADELCDQCPSESPNVT